MPRPFHPDDRNASPRPVMKPVPVVPLLWAMGLAFAYCCLDASPMTQALNALPLDLSDVMLLFTDWGQIKAKLGLENVTGDSPLDARMEFARRSTDDFAVATAYGLSDFKTHAEMWSWDSTDLEWEVNVASSDLPSIYLLKLREGFDFASVSAHFIERGFVQDGIPRSARLRARL